MGRHKKIKVEEVISSEDSNIATLDRQEKTVINEVVEIKEEINIVSKLSVVDKYYDHLFSSASLVYLNISRWGMSAKLSESDLDIEKTPDIIRLGKKLLIKPAIFNQFTQLEQKARTYLKRMSNRFPIAQAHFVANHNLPEVRKQLDAYKEEYEILVTNFIDNYEANKAEALAAYPEYAAVLQPYYPAIGELHGKFDFDYHEFRINMPKELGKVNVNVLLAEEREVEKLTSETKVRLEEQANKQLDQITNFVSDSIKELRANVDSVFAIVINKINKGEIVSDTNIKTLTKKIQEFEKLNIFGDTALAERIENVKAFISEGRDLKDEDNTEDRNALRNYLLEAKNIAQNTTDISNLTGEYFRAIET